MKQYILDNWVNIGLFEQVFVIFLLFIFINVLYTIRNGFNYTSASINNGIIFCISAYGFLAALTVISVLDNNENLVLPLAISVIFHFIIFIKSLIDALKKNIEKSDEGA
ncbi:TPA: hypothetical protein ACGUMV_004046 [Vibrio vulnificus]